MPKTLGYGRISTNDGQDVESQKGVLEQAGAVVVFLDVGDGSKLAGRHQLEAALRLLEPEDTLLCLNPDRIARDTADLLTVAKRVVEKGAVLRVLDPSITFDGTDIAAEVILTVLGLVGRIEKHFIKARQRRGIDAAKARGVYKGRPAKISGSDIVQLRRAGLGPSQIARKLGIGRASVYRIEKATVSTGLE
ncbi:recombinase family protein [Micromonospora sp. STR1s_5]|nr:recombinase family protein [Micromonospora sp. STR1s_5]